MKDRFGREIEYLRISVTQSCNLKCIYCSPDGTRKGNDCASRLTPEEFGTIASAMARLGIRKVRITGGEPLTRPDICDIINLISEIPGIDDISMTTNGIYLAKYARSLKAAGLGRLNISLDSLREDRFRFITGCGKLEDVQKGIEIAVESGLLPLRINTVLIKGVNDDEIDDFISIARHDPVDVRFIELMPIGEFGEQNSDKIVYSSDIIASRPGLAPCVDSNPNQPARYYCMDGFKGRIGFISPMSHKFCNRCNRIRLTCDGRLKPCLGDNGEVSVIDVLRNNPSGLEAFLRTVVYEKPEGHNFERGFNSNRRMNAIGG